MDPMNHFATSMAVLNSLDAAAQVDTAHMSSAEGWTLAIVLGLIGILFCAMVVKIIREW